MDNMPWINISNILYDTFRNLNVKIFACTNQITIPLPDDRQKILEKYHTSAAGGHKGITKTYLRLKNRYYWPNMKTDVQIYIQNCRNCQIKKLRATKKSAR